MAASHRFVDRFVGAPFHARGFALAAPYETDWVPAGGGPWTAHAHVQGCWTHADYPRHLLWKPDENDHVVVVTQLAQSTPSAALALEVGRAALGAAAMPMYTIAYPLALRLPMKAKGAPGFPLPHGTYRCRRLWPPPGVDAYVKDIEGVKAEFRISGTDVGQDVRLYAEAFVGRTHETRQRQPRSLIFSADARHVLLAPYEKRAQRFTAQLMDQLLMFACERECDGLEVDRRRLPGRRLGVTCVCEEEGDDVEFAIRLPQPGGDIRYDGNYFRP
jgi:hypothetical protein